MLTISSGDVELMSTQTNDTRGPVLILPLHRYDHYDTTCPIPGREMPSVSKKVMLVTMLDVWRAHCTILSGALVCKAMDRIKAHHRATAFALPPPSAFTQLPIQSAVPLKRYKVAFVISRTSAAQYPESCTYPSRPLYSCTLRCSQASSPFLRWCCSPLFLIFATLRHF